MGKQWEIAAEQKVYKTLSLTKCREAEKRQLCAAKQNLHKASAFFFSFFQFFFITKCYKRKIVQNVLHRQNAAKLEVHENF